LAPKSENFFTLFGLDAERTVLKLYGLRGLNPLYVGENKMNSNVQPMLETVEKIFTAAYTILEALQPGERMQVKELAQSVGLAVAMDPKEVSGFVNHFAHNTELAYVTRGKNGGIVRGTRPAKVVKSPKKSKADENKTV
jgi:hypothetical protein